MADKLIKKGNTQDSQQPGNSDYSIDNGTLFYNMIYDSNGEPVKGENPDGSWIMRIRNADGTTDWVNNKGQTLTPSNVTILPEIEVNPQVNGTITRTGTVQKPDGTVEGFVGADGKIHQIHNEKPLGLVSPEFALLTLPRAAANGALNLTTQEAREFVPTMIGAYKNGTLAKIGTDMVVGGLGAHVVDNASKSIYGKTWGEELASETGLPTTLTDFTNPGWFTSSLARPLMPLADFINKGVTKGINGFDSAGRLWIFIIIIL